MYKIRITIVPKEVGQLWDQILQNMLNDIQNSKRTIPNQSLTSLIPHTYNQQYKIHQAHVYQQHSPNLCGYHASFNTLCFLNLVKGGVTNYNMQSGASFWRFKKSVQTFLFEIKKKNKLKEEWPWKQSDILHGDFQRSYNKLCLQYFQDFQIFRNHDQFQLYSFTWEFQYKNLLLSQDKRKQLNNYINYFKSYNKEKPLIISFMLAITNHWMSLVAIKIGNQTQYWFFDSLNRHILNLNQQKIRQLVQQIDQERIKVKGVGFTPFFKQNIGVRMKDTQISLRLIVNCLQGKTTIDQYVYNQQFNIFTNVLEKYWDQDHEEAHKTIKDYWHNIYNFFKFPVQHHLFNQQNKHRFTKLVDMTHQIRTKSQQTKRLHQLVKKYSTKASV